MFHTWPNSGFKKPLVLKSLITLRELASFCRKRTFPTALHRKHSPDLWFCWMKLSEPQTNISVVKAVISLSASRCCSFQGAQSLILFWKAGVNLFLCYFEETLSVFKVESVFVSIKTILTFYHFEFDLIITYYREKYGRNFQKFILFQTKNVSDCCFPFEGLLCYKFYKICK